MFMADSLITAAVNRCFFCASRKNKTATGLSTGCRVYQEVPHRVGWWGIDLKICSLRFIAVRNSAFS